MALDCIISSVKRLEIINTDLDLRTPTYVLETKNNIKRRH